MKKTVNRKQCQLAPQDEAVPFSMHFTFHIRVQILWYNEFTEENSFNTLIL
jgi:hypothetical protein